MPLISPPHRNRFFESIADAAFWVQLFDCVPNVYLYVKDDQGRFVAMNRALVAMRGARCESDLLGKTDLDVHPLHWGRRYQEEDRQVMQSGVPVLGCVWLVPDSLNRLTSFISSKLPLIDRHGKSIGIAGVMVPMDTTNAQPQASRRLDKAISKIQDDFASPLSVKQLADAADLSTSQFTRRFREAYQMSPTQYLRRVRVHEACRRLEATDDSIGIIAIDTGFYDQAHFTRVFREVMATSPGEYRRSASRVDVKRSQ